MKQYFQDPAMQLLYEEFVKDGIHYRKAIRKLGKIFGEYDEN